MQSTKITRSMPVSSPRLFVMQYPPILDILLSDFQLRPSIIGLHNTISVGQETNLTCLVEYYFTDITFLWTLDDQSLQNESQFFVKHPNNSVTFRSELRHIFEQKDDHAELICTVSTSSGATPHSSAVATLDLKCKLIISH